MRKSASVEDPIEDIEMLNLQSVEKMTGLRRDTIYRGIREGWFPQNVKVSAWASRWPKHKIAAYLQTCMDAAEKPKAAKPKRGKTAS